MAATTSRNETWKVRCRSPNRVGNSTTEPCTRPWMMALAQATLRVDCCISLLGLRIEPHVGDLVLARALAGLEGDGVAGLLADEGAGQRGRDGDAPLLDVGLEVSHDPV